LTGNNVKVVDNERRISFDGRFFAHVSGKQVLLIPYELERNELVYRVVHTRPNVWRYLEALEAARKSKDKFAESFYIDRLLSLPEQRTTGRFRERLEQTDDPLLMARTAFHHVDFTMALYDVVAVDTLADLGNRLAKRILAQGFLRDGKPDLAVPILEELLKDHPSTEPPVEQLLLAKAHLALNQRDQAKVYYQAAVDWLDRPSEDGPTKKIIELEKELFKITKPLDDPRYNPFQWELWHECDVFRAEVEKLLQTAPGEPAEAK
jgi:tetratricopeptide (TPR) repeat protein